MGSVGGLTSIFSLAPSSHFPLIRATLCRVLRVRSSLPEVEYQRADSTKNLGVGGGCGCWHDFSSSRLGWGQGVGFLGSCSGISLKSRNPEALSNPSL